MKTHVTEEHTLALVFKESKWVIAYDSGPRSRWCVDEQRRTALGWLGPNPLEDLSGLDYLERFEGYFSPEEVHQYEYLPEPNFVVNFEQQIFVDRGDDWTLHSPLDPCLPNSWKHQIGHPFFFVPEEVWSAFVSVQYRDPDTIILPSYLTLGAIKYRDEWTFAYGWDALWILDYASYVSNSFSLDSRNRMTQWRSELAQVETANAADYIHFLRDTVISAEDLPKLRRHLTEVDRFLLEDHTHPEKEITPPKPDITHVIDFDERKYIFYDSHQDQLVPYSVAHAYVPHGWQVLRGKTCAYSTVLAGLYS